MQDELRLHADQCAAAATALATVPAHCLPEVLVGFEGFVDHIIDVVDKRTSIAAYSRVGTIAAFGAKISAAAGQSAGFGTVITTTKLGGNGPIMANALCAQGLPVTTIGILGSPDIELVFQPLAALAKRTISLGPPAVTNALEFDDGKIMLGLTDPMNVITFDLLLERCDGHDGLKRLLRACSGIATVNWTMTPGMNTIWTRLAAEILPSLHQNRPRWFVDLSDPHRRTTDDIREGMRSLSAIQAHADVVLSLNGNECRQLCDACSVPYPNQQPEWEAARVACVALREALGFSQVACHLVRSSAVAWPGGSAAAPGFFEPRPKLTTGAGDHYNAGYFSALLLGLAPAICLQIGSATSCHYVRTASSPDRRQILDLLLNQAASKARG